VYTFVHYLQLLDVLVSLPVQIRNPLLHSNIEDVLEIVLQQTSGDAAQTAGLLLTRWSQLSEVGAE